MPINTDLLIAAPMLQDSFVDKDGLPMSAGIITCYQDNSRTTLKNWYYQSGSPGAYTYIKLPNPLTLSAAGTICDINGVDTIPFFYPYSELDQTVRQPYYITIVNHDQTNQITRQNFPFLPSEQDTPGVGSFDNYIINNGFWRNIGTADLTNIVDMVVAPSQHDGFSSPDIHFIKNVTGGIDTVTFVKFPLTTEPPLTGDITPEFYLNHTCSNTPTGETQKCYQFPVSLHINILASVVYTFTIQAQNAGGTSTGQNVINIFLYQDTGTGTTPPAPTLVGSIALNPSWTKYEFTTIFPDTAGLTLGNGADDAWYIQVQMPLNLSCDINFTRPSLYLSQQVPTNSFLTYDQIDSVINTPRTGDIRTSLNSFYPYGWVPMNNGTIGNATSNATSRANQDTFQLYSLIWGSFNKYNNTTTNLIAQMKNSAGTNVAYGASPIADFNANNAITLTQLMGKVILGTVPTPAYLPNYGTTFTASNGGGNLLITTASNMSFFNGMPVYVQLNSGGSVLPTGITATNIYYVANFNGTTGFNLSTTFANAMAGTVIAYTNSGSGDLGIVGAPFGSFEGEYAHTQLLAELAAHHHGGFGGANFWTDLAAGGVHFTNAGVFNINIAGVTADTGSSTPLNVTQPGAFMNMFMKL